MIGMNYESNKNHKLKFDDKEKRFHTLVRSILGGQETFPGVKGGTGTLGRGSIFSCRKSKY